MALQKLLVIVLIVAIAPPAFAVDESKGPSFEHFMAAVRAAKGKNIDEYFAKFNAFMKERGFGTTVFERIDENSQDPPRYDFQNQRLNVKYHQQQTHYYCPQEVLKHLQAVREDAEAALGRLHSEPGKEEENTKFAKAAEAAVQELEESLRRNGVCRGVKRVMDLQNHHPLMQLAGDILDTRTFALHMLVPPPAGGNAFRYRQLPVVLHDRVTRPAAACTYVFEKMCGDIPQDACKGVGPQNILQVPVACREQIIARRECFSDKFLAHRPCVDAFQRPYQDLKIEQLGDLSPGTPAPKSESESRGGQKPGP